MLWPPDGKNLFTGKDTDAGKDWRQEEQGTTEDEMVGWHHWLDLHEFEQAPGVGDGQGSLLCCSPWGSKVLDMTERLTWTGFRHKKEGALPLWQHGWTVKILWKWKSLSRVRLFVIHGLYSPWIPGDLPKLISNPGLPHCRQILYQLGHQGNPKKGTWWLPGSGRCYTKRNKSDNGQQILYDLPYPWSQNQTDKQKSIPA